MQPSDAIARELPLESPHQISASRYTDPAAPSGHICARTWPRARTLSSSAAVGVIAIAISTIRDRSPWVRLLCFCCAKAVAATKASMGWTHSESDYVCVAVCERL